MVEVVKIVRRDPRPGTAGKLSQGFRGGDQGLLIGLVGQDRQGILAAGVKGAKSRGEAVIVAVVVDITAEPLVSIIQEDAAVSQVRLDGSLGPVKPVGTREPRDSQ